MRFLFLSNFFPRRRPAQAQTRPARTIWRLQYTVSARVSRAALQFKGGAPMSTIAAAAQTADRIDYWIRRHVIQYCYGTHEEAPPPRLISDANGRSVA